MADPSTDRASVPAVCSTPVFFEPLPAPPPPSTRDIPWSPPLWDRPSEGTVPTVLAVNEVVHQSDEAVVVVESLHVYPNGFTIDLGIRLNPHRARENLALMRGPGPHHRIPRVGVRFADGREGGRGLPWRHDMVKDEEGMPLEIVVGMGGGGGGGSQGWHFGYWVYPLPPEGPLEIVVGVPGTDPSAQLREASITLDGTAVRAAATRARVLWA